MMDKELLNRFLKCETTPSEEEAIADWVDADPENRRELDAMQLTMEGLALYAPKLKNARRARLVPLRKIAVRVASIAAVVAVAAGVGFGVASHTLSGWQNQHTIVEVPVGQRMMLTLGDGTQVWLNSGTRLEYPSVFSQKQRRVKVWGEVMFDVEHDAKRPFIVETFACEAEVLGTKFNIVADENNSHFSAALLEGSLKVSNINSLSESVILSPNEMVDLVDGSLELTKFRSHDDFLWVDGLLSLNGLSFEEVMRKFEQYYGVDIIIETPDITTMKYRGKLRISDGLDNALQLLQLTSDFNYTYADDKTIIYVK